MEDVQNHLAQALSKAIAKALEEDSGVEEVREQARAKGFALKLSMEAVIGFANLPPSGTAMMKIQAPKKGSSGRSYEISANDKRFLRSLRIATDEETQQKAE